MKTFAILISLVAAATALPAVNLKTRAPGNVKICTGEHGKGKCETVHVPFNECQQLKAPFLKNVGTFMPDKGAFCRITYTADTCTPHGDAFIWPTPGAPTLHHFTDASGNVVDAGSTITSFLCQECTACE